MVLFFLSREQQWYVTDAVTDDVSSDVGHISHFKWRTFRFLIKALIINRYFYFVVCWQSISYNTFDQFVIDLKSLRMQHVLIWIDPEWSQMFATVWLQMFVLFSNEMVGALTSFVIPLITSVVTDLNKSTTSRSVKEINF